MKTAPHQPIAPSLCPPALRREETGGFCCAVPLIFIGDEKAPFFPAANRPENRRAPQSAPAQPPKSFPSSSSILDAKFPRFCYNLEGIRIPRGSLLIPFASSTFPGPRKLRTVR